MNPSDIANAIPSHGEPVRTEPHAATKAAESMTPSMPMLKTPARSEADLPIAASPIAMPSRIPAARMPVTSKGSIRHPPFGLALPNAVR